MRNTDDEIERIMQPVNTEKFQFANPTPYEVWLNTSNELKSMREELEENQRKQEAENRNNNKLTICGLVVSAVTLAATIIFGILQLKG